MSAAPCRLLALEPATFKPHALHAPDRAFVETNCYVDLWIELLHAFGLEPLALFGCCVAIDFEGDQFTFYKPSHADIARLYGIEVHELSCYRPIHLHALEQLRRGCTIIPETDAWYLPDTVAAGTYRTRRVKTSIAIESIDASRRRLRYFHNAGYFELAGDDFDGLFRIDSECEDAAGLPPFVELVRLDKRRALEAGAQRAVAEDILVRNLARRPSRNPMSAFGERLAADLEQVLQWDETTYQAFTFATVRQYGSAIEILGSFLRWLGGHEEAATHCTRVADGTKTLLFKLVRAATRRQPFDVAASVAPIVSDGDALIGSLQARYRT